ncbi:hypothetical protein JNUCC42_05040 [Brevibacterium sp. JNUCC-42]|nr:hypothetical protein JNUCC42_05040 [Brevibacterium sp. JNUCC-42]
MKRAKVPSILINHYNPQIRFTNALPKNSLGKVLKKFLREQALVMEKKQ